MRWQNKRSSSNVEDRRSQSGRQMGGLGGLPFSGKGKIIALAVVLIAGYYGVDLTPVLTGSSSTYTEQSVDVNSPEQKEAAEFTAVILGTTEDFWGQEFNRLGKSYVEPKLVLYSGVTNTSCGTGQAAMGPFYCPPDSTVYIDLSFYKEMKNKLGGGGDFAQGYVIAHEVGHHVQNLLGTATKVRQLQQNANEKQANKLSVQLELQADCYAGMWGYEMDKQGILDVGDLEEALKTAEAIGDDRLQKQGQGYVVPDSFTHGTSEQRYYWFKRGFDNGDIKQCDTFSQ